MVLFGAILHVSGPVDKSGDLAKAYTDWRRNILEGQQ
jgi:hypothetical protein